MFSLFGGLISVRFQDIPSTRDDI